MTKNIPLGPKKSTMKKTMLLVGGLWLLNSSCTKDYFDKEKLDQAIDQLQWDPEFAIPLVYSTYTIEDLLADNDAASGVVQIGSDKLVTLVYEDELLSLKAEDALQIPNQSFANSFSQPLPIPSYTGSSIAFNGTQSNAFQVGSNNEFDSIHFKGGSLNLQFSSTFQHDVSINLSIPGAKSNGISFNQNVTLDYTGTTPVTQNVTVDLSGYVFDLTESGSTYNSLPINYNITVNGSGSPVNAGDQISFSGSLTNLAFAKIFGYIDMTPISAQPDSLELSIFSLAQGLGQFKLVNPSVHFTLTNSIGVPMNCSFNTLLGLNTFSGNTYDLTSNSQIPNPLPIQSPNLSQIGQELSTNFSLNNQGIIDLINDQPGFFIYGLNAATQSGAGHDNFVLDTSRFKVKARIEMPLYGIADIFTLRDTMDFSLNDSTSSNGAGSTDTSLALDLVSLTLKTIIKNGFPMDVSMQAYFLNSQGFIIDSLLNNFTTIPSAQVDASGRVTTPGLLTIDSEYTKARVLAFDGIKKLVLVAKATTLNNATQDVKIFSDYQLSVKMGVKAKLTTKK